jgi:hypothetical protein
VLLGALALELGPLPVPETLVEQPTTSASRPIDATTDL